VAGPRFLLFTGGVRPAARGREAPDEEPAWTAWRLLSRNNRELGRSPGTFLSAQACVAAVERLRAVASDASRILSVDDRDGRWCWRLTADGVPVAVSSRSYHRQRECVYSLDHFMAAVALAEPPLLVRELPLRARGEHAPSTVRGPGPGTGTGRGTVTGPRAIQYTAPVVAGPLIPIVARPPTARPVGARWVRRGSTGPAGAAPAAAC